MSNSKNDKARTGKSGRSSASSLTDAVVAALAQVEAQDAKSNPPSEPKSAKVDTAATPSPASASPASASPASASPAISAPAASPEPVSSESASDVAVTQTVPVAPVEAAPVEAAPVAAAPVEAAPAVAAAATVAVADVAPDAPDAASAKPDALARDAEGASTDGSPTRPHAAAKVEVLVPRDSSTEGAAREGLTARYYGRTDVGLVREHNEDNFLVADLASKRRGIETAILDTTIRGAGCVFAVCDGMGGAAAGEVASQMAVDTVFEVMDSSGPPRDRDDFARRLVHAIEEAGSRIFAAAKMDRSRRGMGTTSAVAGLIDSTLFVGNVGDSRAYVLRGDQFALISKDQSLVNQLIEAGQLTEEEAEAFEHSNIILQALGTTEEVTVDLTFLELRRGDRLLLCSDGLSGLVHADMMKEVLQGSRDLVDAATQLISMANAGGGHDNITVVLAEFDGTALKEPDSSARVAYQQYPLPPAPPEEDEPKNAPRDTRMKSGGPKPGADVKRSIPSPAPRSGRSRPPPDEGGGSPLIWIGLTVLIVGILAAVAWAISQGGTAEGAPPDRVGALPPASSTPVAPGVVSIDTDLTGGELWVNGSRRGDLESGMTLELAPGAYHLEARAGDARVSEATLSLGAGEHRAVHLLVPTLPGEALPPPSVEVARSELTAFPSGVEPSEVRVEIEDLGEVPLERVVPRVE